MDARLVGYLQRALSHELSAVQQYLAQSALAGMWGVDDVSERLRADASEELTHAQWLIDQMLKLGVAPNSTQLSAVRPGRSIEEMLLIDRDIEIEVIRLYDEAAAYCERTRQPEPHALFVRLLSDEQGHLGDIDVCLTQRRHKESNHG